jgi:hypothetical protein
MQLSIGLLYWPEVEHFVTGLLSLSVGKTSRILKESLQVFMDGADGRTE